MAFTVDFYSYGDLLLNLLLFVLYACVLFLPLYSRVNP